MARLNTRGLRDWIVQRITAVILGVYTIGLLIYLWSHQPLNFAEWYNFHQHLGIKVFTLLALLCLLGHAWIGLWTVFTDYIKNLPLRFLLQVLVLLLLLWYVIWGIQILWGR